MNKAILAIIIILIVAIFGYAVYYFYSANPGVVNYVIPTNIVPKNLPQNTTQSPSENLTSAITIENFAFNPDNITVKAGTVIVWTNNDPAVHQIKIGAFSSGPLSQGDKFQFVVSNIGQYNYSCSIHPSMTGKIIVTQ